MPPSLALSRYGNLLLIWFFRVVREFAARVILVTRLYSIQLERTPCGVQSSLLFMQWSYRGLGWWWWRWWHRFLHPISGDGFHDEEDLPIEGVFVYCHLSPVSADTFFEGTFFHHVPLS